jgi:flavin-dependent dehydrogenase
VKTSWDAIVIGAGPAGALAALRLARHGARTLLVDHSRFPRTKICGGCLAPAGQRALADAGVAHGVLRTGDPGIERLDLTSGGRSVSLRVPRYRVVERSAFDARLVDAACSCGVVFRERTAARVLPQSGVELIDLAQDPARQERVNARVIVVADGLKGKSLTNIAGFGWSVKARNHVGVGAIVDGMPDNAAHDAVTMHHAPCGYLGIAPLAGGRADIAAAVSPEWLRMHSQGTPIVALAEYFGIGLDRDQIVSVMPGSPHLARKRDRIEAEGRIFLCGDAAGYLEPFTGEGMSWALGAASLLSPFLLDALEGRYRTGNWSRVMADEWKRRRKLCRTVGTLLRMPRITRAAVSVCASVPGVGRGVSGVIDAMHGGSTAAAAGAA